LKEKLLYLDNIFLFFYSMTDILPQQGDNQEVSDQNLQQTQWMLWVVQVWVRTTRKVEEIVTGNKWGDSKPKYEIRDWASI